MQYNAVVSPFSDTNPIWACLKNKVPIPWFIMMFPLKMAILGNTPFSDLPIFPYYIYIYIWKSLNTDENAGSHGSSGTLEFTGHLFDSWVSQKGFSLCRLRCHQTWPRDPRTKRAFSYKVNAEIIYWRMFHVLVQVWLPRVITTTIRTSSIWKSRSNLFEVPPRNHRPSWIWFVWKQAPLYRFNYHIYSYVSNVLYYYIILCYVMLCYIILYYNIIYIYIIIYIYTYHQWILNISTW